SQARALPAAVVEQIVAKTDGVPLFVEELTKSVIESGLLREVEGGYELAGPLPPLGIPTTVQDSLLARLDRLATARTVAQLAACIGREFSYELLRDVAAVDEPSLQRDLTRLVDAELLYQRGVPPDAEFVFKHALVQDAAYESLLRSTRQQHHQRIARALVERFPATAQAQPEVVAHHYAEAGLAAEAAPWWLRAAQHALKRYANAEAAVHAQQGLAQIERLPETSERDRLELPLQSLRGLALLTTRGFSHSAAGAAYARARELCQRLGITGGPELSSILFGLWANRMVLGDARLAHTLGGEFIAATSEDDPLRVVAHRMVGYPQMLWGSPAPARDEAERVRAIYDPVRHYPLATPFGQDPGMSALGYGALCWWLTGFPETAVARSEEAFAGLRERPHPHTHLQLLFHCMILHHLRGESDVVRRYAEECFVLGTAHASAFWRSGASVFRGWLLVEDGRPADGVALLQEGMADMRQAGLGIMLRYFGMVQAEALAGAGQTGQALALLDEAVADMDGSVDRFALPEVIRARGEMLLARARVTGSVEPSDVQQVEACFQQALAEARTQEALSLELRAAMSLCRLAKVVHAGEDQREEAMRQLAAAYGRFTEGFDTPDLVAARTLLGDDTFRTQPYAPRP
ncbi:MAG TPA: adenylate cyclase, partial [Chloroflexota bacterium]|nr:adenylate cyclase [Chloroflexota bacterium]